MHGATERTEAQTEVLSIPLALSSVELREPGTSFSWGMILEMEELSSSCISVRVQVGLWSQK